METGYARTVVDCRDVEEWKTVTDRIAYIALPVLPADDACCVVLSSFCRDTAQRHGAQPVRKLSYSWCCLRDS